MPDFEACRRLCDTLCALAREGKLLAVAKPINAKSDTATLLIESMEALAWKTQAAIEEEPFFQACPQEQQADASSLNTASL